MALVPYDKCFAKLDRLISVTTWIRVVHGTYQ